MERKKTIEWEAPDFELMNSGAASGLDYLKGIKRGEISRPPVSKLIGYEIAEIEDGFIAFELRPQEFHFNPFSTVQGGILSVLLDAAMTAAVMTKLKRGLSCSTAEIKVNFIRPASGEAGILRCEAKPIHVGKRLATAEGRIEDADNNLIAHGTTTCLIFKAGS